MQIIHLSLAVFPVPSEKFLRFMRNFHLKYSETITNTKSILACALPCFDSLNLWHRLMAFIWADLFLPTTYFDHFHFLLLLGAPPSPPSPTFWGFTVYNTACYLSPSVGAHLHMGDLRECHPLSSSTGGELHAWSPPALGCLSRVKSYFQS